MPAIRRKHAGPQSYTLKKKRRYNDLAFHYWGNYGGPNYSDGRYQPSVAIGTAPAVDDLDEACRRHDQGYALNSVDRSRLDFQFAGDAFRAAVTPTSLKKTIFALGGGVGVGLQGIARRLDFIEDDRVMQIDGNVPPLNNPEETGPHHFPILTMRKYAKRTRKTKTGRSRRRTRPYAKRRAPKRRYNKKRTTYRSRRTRRSGPKHNYNYTSLMTEYGQTTSDPQMSVAGHGTSAQNLLQAIIQSVVRSLFAHHGTMFSNFNEVIQPTSNTDAFNYQVILTYQNNLASTNIVTELWPVGPTVTYLDLSTTIRRFIMERNFVTGTVNILRYLELYQTDAAFTNKNMLLARVDLSRAVVGWKFYSSIRIQNRTANASANTTTDVNNVNPLEAKAYYGKYGKNYMIFNHKGAYDQPLYKPWCPVSNYGSFDDTAAKHAGDDSWKELPNKNMTGAYMVKNFAIHPGQVIVDSMSAKGKALINDILVKMFSSLAQQGGTLDSAKPVPMALGLVRAYGFEKLVWDRTEEAPVLLGWEVNQTYGATVSYKKVRASPVVDSYDP